MTPRQTDPRRLFMINDVDVNKSRDKMPIQNCLFRGPNCEFQRTVCEVVCPRTVRETCPQLLNRLEYFDKLLQTY